MTAELSFFTKNIQALSHKNPELAKRIQCSREAGFIRPGEEKDGSCYTEPALSKTGLIVPRLTGGKAAHSLYDPQKEADSIAGTLSEGFILFAALGGGYHIRSRLKQNPGGYNLIAEKNPASYAALFSCADYTDLIQNSRVSFCLADTIKENLIKLYIPAIYGSFALFPLRAWSDLNRDDFMLISDTVSAVIQLISRDFSVQSHFGKIWFRNILRNLNNASKRGNNIRTPFPIHKTAAVIGAGPSVDKSWIMLSKNRSAFYVIAADTALQALIGHNIIPDAFVSIDGQNISYLHLMKGLPSETLAVIDLCAHPAAAELSRGRVLFTSGSHPLAQLANMYGKKESGVYPFPFIDTGSGTVTLAALDFACKAGFTDIVLHGADFAYIDYKPYTRGTYLDDVFFAEQNRTNGIEQRFAALMFRTPLLHCGGESAKVISSAVLENYALQTERYVQNAGVSIKRALQDGIKLNLQNSGGGNACTPLCGNSFSFDRFLDWYKKQLRRFCINTDTPESYDIRTSLLPLAAWAAKKGLYNPGSGGFDTVIKLALHTAEGYTVGYHE